MITIVYFGIAGLLLCLEWTISGRRLWGYLAAGLTFGLYNEICFEFCWDYSPMLKPMIWRDVPLLIILGWGLITGLSLSISDRMARWLKLKNPWPRKLLDVLLFFFVGYPNELLMSKLGYWKYNFPLLAVPWAQIFGYVFVGILVSFAGRGFQAMLDDGMKRKSRP
jgi:hypothetical protein